ncbi:MAG: hypothetical protein O6758_01390 [Planctomycetota bacterium]|nr:hypothetical protein [Planctomycetota bacterium]
MIHQRSITWLAILSAVAAAGCAAGPTASPQKPRARPRHSIEPLARPAGITRTSHVQVGILPLGSVPYDNLSLPIVSPDGRFVATQTGVPPTWAALMAAPNATVPRATHIEIYQLDRELRRAVHRRTLGEPLLLGRSCDARGFLVESVRPNGARWIGRVAWLDGEIEWLVADEQTNSNGCLGPKGRLAWSRRARDADHFDLVVRSSGEEWTIGSQGGDWLFPAWSGHGDGLFALRLTQGMLEATHMIAASPTTIHQTLRRLPLASQATIHHAYQAMASQSIVTEAQRRGPEQLIFFHPVRLRMALWRPISRHQTTPILLGKQSSAAAAVGTGFALVATEDHLMLQNLENLSDRTEVIAGLQVPRQVASPDWPYLLLAPTEGRIGLIALRLLHTDDGRAR